MLKLLVMAVYLIACSHVRISSCSASTPLFSYQRVWECFTGGSQGPAPQRSERGRSSNQGWSRTIGKRTELWKRAEDTQRQVCIHATMQAHVNPRICTVGRTAHAERLTLIFLAQAYEKTSTSQALYHALSSCSFPNHGKNPLSPLAWTSHGICLLQYDVSRHLWPQLSRKTSEPGERNLCFVEGSWASLVGCIHSNASY